jgi:hypothetical protein
VTEDGQRWRAVDPEDRCGSCLHARRYEAADTPVTMCLICGAEVEPVLAEVLDLGAARWRRSRRNRWNTS